MTYDELFKNAGDYTGVFTNLVLEKDINWNVVGVLANLMKCDKIGVVVSTRSLAEHCNIALSTVLSAIGVLREKGIISNKKVGYTVNYDALYNLVIECNERSKEMTKNSKRAEKQSKSVSKNMTLKDEGVSKNMTEVYRKSVQECTEKHDNNIYNINNKNNKPKNFICNNQGNCNTEVKQNITNKKKQYIVPKVLKVFTTEYNKNSSSVFSSSFSSVEGEGTKVNNTSSAERLNSLRSRVEVAKKELLDEFETIVQGAEGYIAAINACYYKWEEYRERIVKAAGNTKCTEEEYQLLSDYFIDSCRLHAKYEVMAADKFVGYCEPSIVSGNLEQAIYEYLENNKRATA